MGVTAELGVLAVAWVVLVNIIIYSLNEHSYLARKVGFQGALTVSSRAKGVGRERRPEQYFAWDLLDPNHLVGTKLIVMSV